MVPIIAIIGAALGAMASSMKQRNQIQSNLGKALERNTGRNNEMEQEANPLAGAAAGALAAYGLGKMGGSESPSAGVEDTSVVQGPKSANPWNNNVNVIEANPMLSGNEAVKTMAGPRSISPSVAKSISPSMYRKPNQADIEDIAASIPNMQSREDSNPYSFLKDTDKQAGNIVNDPKFQQLAMLAAISKTMKNESPKQPVEQQQKTPIFNNEKDQSLAALIAALSSYNKGERNV